MTDPIVQTASSPAEQPATGFGEQLMRAREAHGLSVGEMAARLRLHPKQVAALEQERLEALPEPAFVRGFLRNYAKELGLDPAPLLAALAQRQAPPTETAALGGPPAEVRRAVVERTSRLVVIVGVIVLLAVLGLIGWLASSRADRAAGGPPGLSERGAPEASSPVRAGASPQVAPDALGQPAAGLATGADTVAAPAAAAGAAPAAPEAVAPAAARSGADDLPAASGASTAARPSTAVAAAGAPSLRLAVGDRPSWVEITQADGRVVLTGLLEAGTERRLGPVQPPLRLVIGNATSVTLEYRGRNVDLAPHVRGNDLARLSLD